MKWVKDSTLNFVRFVSLIRYFWQLFCYAGNNGGELSWPKSNNLHKRPNLTSDSVVQLTRTCYQCISHQRHYNPNGRTCNLPQLVNLLCHVQGQFNSSQSFAVTGSVIWNSLPEELWLHDIPWMRYETVTDISTFAVLFKFTVAVASEPVEKWDGSTASASPLLPPLPCREAAPSTQLVGLGERCKLPQWGLGQSPRKFRIWCILRHLVASILMSFLRNYL